MKEHWLPVPGLEGSYEVSDLGRVRSLDRVVPHCWGSTKRIKGKLLKPGTDEQGRNCHRLSDGASTSTQRVHRLVLTAFVGQPPPGFVCCHNNGDPTDNRLSNLRWDSQSGNMRDAVRHGTWHSPMAERTHCPYGHALTEPNLVAAKLKHGVRNCRACARAISIRASGNYLAQEATAKDGTFDFQSVADGEYAKIMGRGSSWPASIQCDGVQYHSVAALVQLFGRTEVAWRRLAGRQNWRRLRRGLWMYYDARDVATTLRRNHAA
jgi:hypothetical protein